MSRNRDPLVRSARWHVDCRIVADLPEDTVVGTRFLINVVFTAMALAALLYAGWLGTLNLSMRYQIRDWEQRMKANQAEVRELQHLQQEYAVEGAKIDQADALVRPRFQVSAFIASIGRTRPERLVIDVIEWNEAGIVIRGSLQENSERVSKLLSDYLRLLKGDEQLAPLFPDIHQTYMNRVGTEETFKFEIFFGFKSAKP